MEFDITINPYAIRADQITKLHKKIVDDYCSGDHKYTLPRMIKVSNKLYLHLCSMHSKAMEYEKQMLLKEE